MKIFSALLLILIAFFYLTVTVSARITPEDILNSKRSTYEQRVQNYSPLSKEKLEKLSQKITDLNKKITGELGQNMERQGQILDEYQRRHIGSDPQADSTRYWLTFAHEAVAYQAAKIYVFNLTNEQNMKNDVNSTISLFESDINILSSKVLKSQKIIKTLVSSK